MRSLMNSEIVEETGRVVHGGYVFTMLKNFNKKLTGFSKGHVTTFQKVQTLIE